MIIPVIVIFSCIIIFVLAQYLLEKKKVKELIIYKDITLSVINSDPKTRKMIEKQCNEYLEHKVINSKSASNKYLAQANLILDNIKYINMIYSIEPIEIQEKKSIIEKAIETATEENKMKKEKNTKKEEN